MASKTDKRMEVCEVCGALLVTHDAGEKPTAHFDGKQHLGYLKIRETLDKHNVSHKIRIIIKGKREKGKKRIILY